MTIRSWRASHHARIHMLDKHDVWWDEVVEAAESGARVERGPNKGSERRYFIQGRTVAGRPLTVVFRLRGDTAWVITAFEED